MRLSASSLSLPFTNVLSQAQPSSLALGIILFFHVCATCILMPPWDVFASDPLLVIDHAVHTHRIQLYKETLLESGLPWGYDPRVSAGFVMNPKNDVGAKPQQVLGLLLPFLAPGTVERLFVFLVALTIPLWTLLACRRLGIGLDAQIWILAVLLIPAWLYDNLPKFFVWGLVAFAGASYFVPYVLALFLDFLNKPKLNTYLRFLFAGCILLFLHVLGPVILVVPLLLLTLLVDPLLFRWRLAAMAAPVAMALANAFWLIPFCLAFWGMPDSPVLAELVTNIKEIPHLATRHMTYAGFDEILSAFSPLRVGAFFCGLVLVPAGLLIMRRMLGNRVACAFALTGLLGFGLKFFGSFSSPLSLMQPARFILPTFVILSIPMGLVLYWIVNKRSLPAMRLNVAVILCAVAVALALNKPESLAVQHAQQPANVLSDFAFHRTEPHDRLLIQSMGWEPRILALTLGREVVGNSFPFTEDTPQFLPSLLWGRPIPEWSPQEMSAILQRWGITWCFTHNGQAGALFEKVSGTLGERIGKYTAFHFPDNSGRFLKGTGQIVAAVNRIELSHLRSENGLIVLRYRYHPAWETSSGSPVIQYSIPEDPKGFIALRNPKEAITLAFNPLKVLSAPWPNGKMD